MIHGRLFLLGSIRLTAGPGFHGTPLGLRAEETAQMLAYLALKGNRPVHRQQLAFRLWPDCDEATARRHLRQHLHRLRQLLESAGFPNETIESHARQLRLDPDAGLWVDVHAFERLAADRGKHIEALEIYGGDLLAGHDQPWILPERIRLRDTYLRLLHTQIDVAKMARNYPRAVHYAQRLLKANPLRESSHRIYMEALYLDGRRAAALRQYEQLRELLVRELDVAPMAETGRLAEQIRDGTLPRDVPTVGPGEPAALRTFTTITDRLIGRRGEVATLDQALARAHSGRGAFLLLRGSSGRGKSFLLEAWLEARQSQILALTSSSCPPAMLDALDTSEIDWSLFPNGYPGLDRLRAAAMEGASDNDVDTAQLGNVLLTLATRCGQTVTVIIDDLDQAGNATWDAVAYVARRCARGPLLLLGAADSTSCSDHAHRLWHSLRAESQVNTLPIGALSPADCAALAEQRLGDPLPAGVRNALYRETEGHPGHVAAFVDTAGTVASLATALAQIPAPVAARVTAQMERLPPSCRAIIRQAAECGRSFAHAELVRDARAEPEQLIGCLEAAIEHGLLVEFGDGYAFPHRLTRRAVGDDRQAVGGEEEGAV